MHFRDNEAFFIFDKYCGETVMRMVILHEPINPGKTGNGYIVERFIYVCLYLSTAPEFYIYIYVIPQG